MHHGPPPLFKQGTPARIRAGIFLLLAVGLLLADARLSALNQVRYVINLFLYPIQKAAMMPRDAISTIGEYFETTTVLQKEVRNLRQKELENAQKLQQADQLLQENTHLRQLLALSDSVEEKSVSAEILYDARTTFSRKIIVNRGTQEGITPGLPVIDANGVIGQVTRVFLSSSEVTLLTDKDQVIPVLALRSGLRSVAYGRGEQGYLELRFVVTNDELKEGDLLVTSGIDGVYPAGLAVAKVVRMGDKLSETFNHVVCEPLGGISRNRQVLILLTTKKLEPRPPEEEEAKPARRRRVEKPRKK